jgi:hypothetical protein
MSRMMSSAYRAANATVATREMEGSADWTSSDAFSALSLRREVVESAIQAYERAIAGVRYVGIEGVRRNPPPFPEPQAGQTCRKAWCPETRKPGISLGALP